jgi:hypothetical protein
MYGQATNIADLPGITRAHSGSIWPALLYESRLPSGLDEPHGSRGGTHAECHGASALSC